MTTFVSASLRVQGIHCWPAAPAAVVYLASPHRHEFHVRVRKQVSGPDREVEVIQFKHAVEAYFLALPRTHNMIDFGTRSCEQIAAEIVENCAADWCEVLEDGENGAEVFA
jgi:hypothetical protein